MSQKYDIDNDFNDFSSRYLEDTQRNSANLVRLGLIDEDKDGWLGEDDTLFGTNFVYCGSHCRVHSTGWCTVSVAKKRPLRGETIEDAEKYANTKGLI